MDKIFCVALVGLGFIGSQAAGQNYVSILPTDGPADIIRKAAQVAPSPRQLRWQQLELTAFFHFGINTFTDREWGDGKEDPAVFNPKQLHARQWVRVAKEAGIKQVILTAKHHDGFCLWPSKFTDHTIAHTPYKGGHGDIVREFADACHEYGMGLGLYLSPWDRNSPVYGDSAKYNALFLNWLTELLTQYGRVDEIWFDGANGEGPNGKKQVYAFEAWYHLIRRLQPQAVIAIMGPDVRWVGTESGQGRLTEWSVLPVNTRQEESIAANSQRDQTFAPLGDLMNQDLGSRERLLTAKGLIWYPAETDVSIRPGWFYHASEDTAVRTPSGLMDLYFSSVGRNSVLLLNIPPNRAGLISDADVRSLRGWRRLMDGTFGGDLAAGALRRDSGMTTEIDLRGDDGADAVSFDVLMLQEDIRVGQRVEQWVFEVESDGGWVQIASGTTIGYKRLLRFPAVTARRVRLRILSSRLDPVISKIGLYKLAEPNVTAVVRPDVGKTNSWYVSNRAPLLPLNFIKLPVGAIQPGGCVRRFLELQRDGLTGHLGEISAWLDKKDNAWYSGTGEGSHGWEEVPYWLKGYGDLGYLLRDSGMIATTRDWLEKVFLSQRADGYFGPRVVENPAKDSIPDLWPNMLMLWCMQSYYEYSGDPRVLTFMTRYFRWELGVPEGQLLRTYWENSRGGDNLYSVYWLYDHTGEGWLLDLAAKIHRCTANWMQDTVLPNWHNVNVAQCFREPATYYMQAKDSGYLRATYADFALMRKLYGQVPGGMFGADEDARKGYDDPRQAVETCGMVEQMASDELLMGITGDPAWGDNCEDVAFNTYPAAVLPDFRGLRYLTAPNLVVSDDRNHSPGIQNSGPFLLMNPFSSRCCQHNHSQGWPYYAEHLWMATPDNGVAALLYSDCTVKVRVGEGTGGDGAGVGAGDAGGSGLGAGGRVAGGNGVVASGNGVVATITETTHYPFDSTVRFRIGVGRAVAFPMYLRIPSWCSGALIRINGKDAHTFTGIGGYGKVEKTWVDGDEVELVLPMRIQVRTWDHNKNSVSVNYGPLTFSLKIKEDYVKVDSKASAIGDSKWQAGADQTKWPAFEILPGSAWNYGLEIGRQTVAGGPTAGDFEIARKPWPADNFPFTPASVPIELKAKGRLIPEWKVDQYGLCGVLPTSPVVVHTPEETLTLIPMGAARLRISSFPVVKD